MHWVITKYEKEEVESNNETTKKKSRSKKRRKSVIEMDNWKERILSILCSVLHQDLPRLWKREKAEDAFIMLFFKIAFSFMENSENIKSEAVKQAVFKLIITSLQTTSDNMQTVVSSILHMIMTIEHMAHCIVDMIEMIVKNTSSSQDITTDNNSTIGKLFVSELFREIGRLENNELNMDSAGTKNLSLFITEMGDRVPQTVLANMSVVVSHLNDESYQIRNAVIQAISRIISNVLIPASQENNSRNTTSENLTKKTRDQLLGILEERIQDINAYTRSKVIQCWSYLCEEKAIPLNILAKVVDFVTGRLYDKSAFVRKAAVHFLTSILESNPYGHELQLSVFKTKLEEHKKLLDTLPKLTETEREMQLLEGEKTEEQLRRENVLKLCIYHKEAVRFTEQIHEAIPSICQLLGSKTSSDVIECINFFIRAYNFKLEAATVGLKKVLKLVWSAEQSVKDAASDAIHSIFMDMSKLTSANMCIEVGKQFAEFVISCNKSELAALECIVNIQVLKDRFPRILFLALWEIIGEQYEEKHNIGALMILNMIATARPEPIRKKIKTLITDGLGPRSEKNFLIAYYTYNILQKLAMDDSSEAFQDKKKTKSTDDDEMLKYSGGNKNFRLSNDNKVFKILIDSVIDKEGKIPISNWMVLTEAALNSLFALAEKPEQLATHIIKEVSLKTNAGVEDSQSQTLSISPVELTKLFFLLGHCSIKELVNLEQQFKKAKKLKSKLSEEKEKDVEEPKKKKKTSSKSSKKGEKVSKKKRDRADLEEEESQAEQEKNDIEKELGLDPTNIEDHVLEETFEEREKAIITETSLYGSYLPLILNICCDNGNVYKYSILRRSAILALCKYMCVSQSVCDKQLQLLFTILVKSPKEMNSRASIDGYATIRNNIIVSIGDLACRFPNSVERYIHHLYSCLRDRDSRVRKNTLLVLSHLVLNDMIKVKSNIFEIVRCIEDKNEEISQISKSFFTELSKKASGNNNPIYNLLPTILSNLSQKSADISAISFQNIMKFLISFVTKVQHNEKLVKKLCQRFDLVKISTQSTTKEEVYERTMQEEDILQELDITKHQTIETEDEVTKTDFNDEMLQQWRNLAYCLAQLLMSDKCIQILLSEECMKSYKKALMDYEVYEYMISITTKYKKTASTKGGKKGANSELGVLSPELRDAIEEWEKQIKQIHLKLSEEHGLKSNLLNEDADEDDEESEVNTTQIRAKRKNAKTPGKTPGKTPRGKVRGKTPGKTPKTTKKKVESEDELSDFDDLEEEEEEEINELLDSDESESELDMLDSEDDE